MPTNISGVVEGPFRRRRKGATRYSCAECRRLKLKCDRSIPCSSCVKRGCSAICPDGSLTTGQGNRFILASTEVLHEKISGLSNRVRQLEDALRFSHSQLSRSSDPHPLLTDELLEIKAPLQREPPPSRNGTLNPPREEEPNPDIVDAFGSLSISLSGRTKYFGHTANSWYFLQNELSDEDELEEVNLVDILPPEVLARSVAFPISPAVHLSLQLDSRTRGLLRYLPRADRAAHLRSLFFRYAAWMYTPISLESFNEQIFSQFFEATPVDDPLLPHRQSLLFMVLAIGSLMDFTQPAFNVEAEKYHQLARATLFSNSLFEEPTIHAVQTLFLMTFYLFFADRHGTGSGSRWSIMGLAVKIAQSIGLHRDSGRWKVDQAETKRRRELFWELYTYDSWQCLTFGRPPSFALAHIDCKLPHAPDASDDQSFHSWKHRFTSEVMSTVHDQAFGAKTPTYATILQLDHHIRAFPIPPVLQIVGFGSSEPRPGGYPESDELILQRHIVLARKETDLLYLHRGFFARAMSDYAKDPLGSPHGTSVIAAHRSACSFIALMRNLHSQLREPSERLWFLWAHMFSCAIVLGAIVTRCPSMRFAPSALGQLDAACSVFAEVASGFRAQKVLTIMLRLRDKAHASMDDFKADTSLSSTRRSSIEPPVNNNDELDTLGGKTRLVANKESSASPQLVNRSPGSLNSGTSLPVPPASDNHVHPSVAEYMQASGGPHFVPGTEPHALITPYADSSIYGLAPIPLHHETSYNHQMQLPQQQQYAGPQTQTPYLPMADVSLTQYSPVYNYAPQNGYHPMQMDSEMMNVSAPEANMHTTWHDFVAGFGMN